MLERRKEKKNSSKQMVKLDKYLLLELSVFVDELPEVANQLKLKMDRYEKLINEIDQFEENSFSHSSRRTEIKSLHKKLTNFVKYRMFEEP